MATLQTARMVAGPRTALARLRLQLPVAPYGVRRMRATIRKSIAAAAAASPAFTVSPDPTVSVVMPVYNNWSLTRRALSSLTLGHAQGLFEVIVVDDGSSDETRVAAAAVPGLRVVSLSQNLGFTHAANRGAQQARGALVMFLNNDTLVLPGAVEALVDAMRETSIGAAGARLVFPTGWLQEAGAVVRGDGSCAHSGWGASPADPRYAARHDADYCSAAALMVRASLLQAIGWFDSRFAPAYYEDVDLCFAIRARGSRVVVEPAATVVHWEGMTHGTEWRRGIHRSHGKSNQVRNQARFVAKWSTEVTGTRPGTELTGRSTA